MDVALAVAGLAAEFGRLLDERDFEGAETYLILALTDAPAPLRAFLHLQFAKLYREWDKLTSAIDHLHRAIELKDVDVYLRVQILEELRVLKDRQALQRP